MIDHPFPPVVDEGCRVLVLGSFPSVKSRANAFYYGHPQNRFWRMMAAVLGEPTPQSIGEKRGMLLRHGIALWDVIASCEIVGSADASVKDVAPVDIARVTDMAHIDRVICNGALAGKLYQRHLQDRMGVEAVVAPSTSPANAAWSLERLVAAWRKLLME